MLWLITAFNFSLFTIFTYNIFSNIQLIMALYNEQYHFCTDYIKNVGTEFVKYDFAELIFK